MEQQITIYDRDNNPVGKTFRRRAKQLVGKQRAVWLDEKQTSIRLTAAENEEETEMENNYVVLDKPEKAEHAPMYSAESLLALAKINLRERQIFKRHIFAFVTTWLTYLFMESWGFVRSMFGRNRSEVALTMSVIFIIWGIFIVFRAVRVYFPSFKLFRTKNDPLNAEYERLKKLDSERVADEYRKWGK